MSRAVSDKVYRCRECKQDMIPPSCQNTDCSRGPSVNDTDDLLERRDYSLDTRDDSAMEAYYYGFDRTGVVDIDRVLAEVAWAGKAYHNTGSWNEDEDAGGETVVDRIQRTANEAATKIRELQADRERVAANARDALIRQLTGPVGDAARLARALVERRTKMPSYLADDETWHVALEDAKQTHLAILDAARAEED